MSAVFSVRVAVAALAVLALQGSAGAQALKPFKDDLFAYPKTLSAEGMAYRVIDYREARDIDERDEVPERRVRRQYVSTGVRSVQEDLALATEAGTVRHVAVGRRSGARIITVYLHGQGGSRRQGVDDFTFGGNFNRIKNLMAGNDGLYLSPDFSDFGDKGAAEVAALLAHYAKDSPRAKIVVACGSMGGALCWKLAARPDAGRLSGLMLLGSHWDESYLKTESFRRGLPLFFAHGSRDTVFPVGRQEAFFRAILARSPSYPARFVRFETGTHGTPIRMADWRETLEWMLSQVR